MGEHSLRTILGPTVATQMNNKATMLIFCVMNVMLIVKQISVAERKLIITLYNSWKADLVLASAIFQLNLAARNISVIKASPTLKVYSFSWIKENMKIHDMNVK